MVTKTNKTAPIPANNNTKKEKKSLADLKTLYSKPISISVNHKPEKGKPPAVNTETISHVKGLRL